MHFSGTTPDSVQTISINQKNSYSTAQTRQAPAPQVLRPGLAQPQPAPPLAGPSVARRAATPPAPRPSPVQPIPSPSAFSSVTASRTTVPPVARPPIQRTSTLPTARSIPAQQQPSSLQEVVIAQDDGLQKELEQMRLQLEVVCCLISLRGDGVYYDCSSAQTRPGPATGVSETGRRCAHGKGG